MTRKLRSLLMLVAVTFAVSSCATDIIPFATGGSKADGTVTLAYEYNYLQTPVIDWEEAEKEALSVCRRWGYSKAEAFGGSRRACVVAGQYGCTVYTVTTEYQCSN